jgi:hypothetical protein
VKSFVFGLILSALSVFAQPVFAGTDYSPVHTPVTECNAGGYTANSVLSGSFKTNVLKSSEHLDAGDALVGCSGGSTLEMHTSGDVILYMYNPSSCSGYTTVSSETSQFAGQLSGVWCPVWHTNTAGNTGAIALMGWDGNFWVFSAGYGSGIWSYGSSTATKLRLMGAADNCSNSNSDYYSNVTLALFDDKPTGGCSSSSDGTHTVYTEHGDLRAAASPAYLY